VSNSDDLHEVNQARAEPPSRQEHRGQAQVKANIPVVLTDSGHPHHAAVRSRGGTACTASPSQGGGRPRRGRPLPTVLVDATDAMGRTTVLSGNARRLDLRRGNASLSGSNQPRTAGLQRRDRDPGWAGAPSLPVMLTPVPLTGLGAPQQGDV
jgi:hypothetical protein